MAPNLQATEKATGEPNDYQCFRRLLPEAQQWTRNRIKVNTVGFGSMAVSPGNYETVAVVNGHCDLANINGKLVPLLHIAKLETQEYILVPSSLVVTDDCTSQSSTVRDSIVTKLAGKSNRGCQVNTEPGEENAGEKRGSHEYGSNQTRKKRNQHETTRSTRSPLEMDQSVGKRPTTERNVTTAGYTNANEQSNKIPDAITHGGISEAQEPGPKSFARKQISGQKKAESSPDHDANVRTNGPPPLRKNVSRELSGVFRSVAQYSENPSVFPEPTEHGVCNYPSTSITPNPWFDRSPEPQLPGGITGNNRAGSAPQKGAFIYFEPGRELDLSPYTAGRECSGNSVDSTPESHPDKFDELVSKICTVDPPSINSDECSGIPDTESLDSLAFDTESVDYSRDERGS